MAPANPGGGWDQTARQVQQVLSGEHILPVPAEVVNRGGAGGTIGLSELVARDDSHTMMVMGRVMLGSILTNQSPVSLKSTIPLARLLDEHEVIAVAADSKYRNCQELIEGFKRDPRHVSWGGGSAGGTDHILVAMLAQAAGVDPKSINYIAYSGGGEAAVSVMGGHVTAGIAGYGEWKPHADSGKLRFIAISSEQRPGPDSPPTIKDCGLNVTVSNWRAIVSPQGTKPETRDWLVAAIARMHETRAWQEILRKNDWTDSFLIGEELDRFIDSETVANTEILKSIGLVSSGQPAAQYAAVGPWVFPTIIGLGLILCGAWLTVAAVTGRRRSRIETSWAAGDRPCSVDWRSAAASGLLLLVYILLLTPIGYLISTTLFLFLEARLLGSRSTVRDGIFSIATSVSVYALFNFVLKIGLPTGILG